MMASSKSLIRSSAGRSGKPRDSIFMRALRSTDEKSRGSIPFIVFLLVNVWVSVNGGNDHSPVGI
jgi:hypothetical protein